MKTIMYVEEGKPTPNGGFGGSLYSMIETIMLIQKYDSNYKFVIVTFYEIPVIYNLIERNQIEYQFIVPFDTLQKSWSSNAESSRSKFIRLPFFLKTDISMYLKLNRVRKYVKIIDKFKPFVIWGNNSTAVNFPWLISAALKKTPYVQHQRAELASISFNYFISLFFSGKVIAISNYVRNTLFKVKVIQFLFSKKVSVIHNFDEQLQNYKKFDLCKIDGVQFIYIGRLIPKKNLEEFFYIISKIVEHVDIKDFSVQVYGDWIDDEYKNKIKSISAELRFNRKIKFNKFTDKKDIFKRTKMNFLFHTTRRETPEPFGRALLDASLYGAIPITNGFGGAGEVIQNDKNGFIYEIDFLNPIYEVVRKYIDNHELYFQHLTRHYNMNKAEFSGQKQILQIQEILSGL